jgi:hypothetical protein
LILGVVEQILWWLIASVWMHCGDSLCFLSILVCWFKFAAVVAIWRRALYMERKLHSSDFLQSKSQGSCHLLSAIQFLLSFIHLFAIILDYLLQLLIISCLWQVPRSPLVSSCFSRSRKHAGFSTFDIPGYSSLKVLHFTIYPGTLHLLVSSLSFSLYC